MSDSEKQTSLKHPLPPSPAKSLKEVKLRLELMAEQLRSSYWKNELPSEIESSSEELAAAKAQLKCLASSVYKLSQVKHR